MQNNYDYKKLKQFRKSYSIIVYSGLILSIIHIVFCYLFLNNAYIALLGFFLINIIFIFVIAKDNEKNYFKLYDELIVKKVLNNNFKNVNIQLEKENKHKINFINIFFRNLIFVKD